ncbi:MAG TPA: hypothetical protein VGQ83_03800 [Polyangia bacterium]|jgi:hypothetical protein
MTKKPAEPSHAPAPPAADPRSRVTGYMRKLLETAALTGAALGLGVVESCGADDPLPPPLVCPGEDAGVSSAQYARVERSAHWVAADGGTLVVSVSLTLTSWPYHGGFAGEPSATNATVSWATPVGDALELIVTPDPGATTVDVAVPLTCLDAAITDRFRLDVSSPTAGGSVPITPAP